MTEHINDRSPKHAPKGRKGPRFRFFRDYDITVDHPERPSLTALRVFAPVKNQFPYHRVQFVRMVIDEYGRPVPVHSPDPAVSGVSLDSIRCIKLLSAFLTAKSELRTLQYAAKQAGASKELSELETFQSFKKDMEMMEVAETYKVREIQARWQQSVSFATPPAPPIDLNEVLGEHLAGSFTEELNRLLKK
jgi:hypothetical protein